MLTQIISKFEKNPDDKILNIQLKVINTDIKGLMHGQKNNIKPIGYLVISTSNQKGLSEIYIATYISNAVQSLVDFLSFKFSGKSISEFGKLYDSFNIPFVSRDGIFRAIMGCLESAFLDLLAKRAEVPLYKLFVDQMNKSKIYASGGSVIMSSSQILDELDYVNQSEFDGYKMRVGYYDWNEDMKRVHALRDQKIKCMVDAISGTRLPPWSLDDATEKVKFLEDCNVYWLEEPLSPSQLSEMAELQNSTSLHIAAGEAYSGVGEYELLMNIGNIDVIQFDACHSGGFSVCMQTHNSAKKLSKKTAIHVWGSIVAVNTNYHLSLALNELDFFEVPLIELGINRNIFEDVGFMDRRNQILDLPGIGIDAEKVLDLENSKNFENIYEW